MRTWRWYSKVLLALVALAFAYWVWPTPYRYWNDHAWSFRVNRFTGTAQAVKALHGGTWEPSR